MCSSTYKELNNLVTCTRYTYLYCMPRMCISINFEPTMHITVSKCGTCFWDNQPCATKCEDGKAYVERVRGSERGFKHLTEAKIWSFLKTAMCFFASLAAAPLSY